MPSARASVSISGRACVGTCNVMSEDCTGKVLQKACLVQFLLQLVMDRAVPLSWKAKRSWARFSHVQPMTMAVLVVHFVYHRAITVNHGRFDGTCAGLSRLCLPRPRALNERSGFAEASLARAASSGQAELECRPVRLKLMEPRNWMLW